MNYFNVLNEVNVSDKIEKKNGLSYLSWAYAWSEVKKRYPLSFYTIYENQQGWNYFSDGRTGWVKTGVTIVFEDGTSLEHIEYLPIMDHRNQSIVCEKITSFDVNKTIQRSLTKAVARHGLGLYVYAGEDLPEDSKEVKTEQPRNRDELVKEYKELENDLIVNYSININDEQIASYIKKLTNIQEVNCDLLNANELEKVINVLKDVKSKKDKVKGK